MSKVIAIANQKGGVAKTTTAINLSACLADMGQKVLVIDMDPQGNATSGLGVDKQILERTVYDLLSEKAQAEECIMDDVFKNLSILPANRDLSAIEVELIGVDNREYILKNKIDLIKEQYDFIIIDTPPSLNQLTINAMTTANAVIVPIQCEYLALEGLGDIMYTIQLVNERLNPDIKMEGVVFTMYDARTNLSLQVVEEVKQNLHENIYKTIIPRNIKLAEAPSHGLPITHYEPRSVGAESYMYLAKEVIEKSAEAQN